MKTVAPLSRLKRGLIYAGFGGLTADLIILRFVGETIETTDDGVGCGRFPTILVLSSNRTYKKCLYNHSLIE